MISIFPPHLHLRKHYWQHIMLPSKFIQLSSQIFSISWRISKISAWIDLNETHFRYKLFNTLERNVYNTRVVSDVSQYTVDDKNNITQSHVIIVVKSKNSMKNYCIVSRYLLLGRAPHCSTSRARRAHSEYTRNSSSRWFPTLSLCYFAIRSFAHQLFEIQEIRCRPITRPLSLEYGTTSYKYKCSEYRDIRVEMTPVMVDAPLRWRYDDVYDQVRTINERWRLRSAESLSFGQSRTLGCRRASE